MRKRTTKKTDNIETHFSGPSCRLLLPPSCFPTPGTRHPIPYLEVCNG